MFSFVRKYVVYETQTYAGIPIYSLNSETTNKQNLTANFLSLYMASQTQLTHNSSIWFICPRNVHDLILSIDSYQLEFYQRTYKTKIAIFQIYSKTQYVSKSRKTLTQVPIIRNNEKQDRDKYIGNISQVLTVIC